MRKKGRGASALTRRCALRWGAGMLGALPLAMLAGCSSQPGERAADASTACGVGSGADGTSGSTGEPPVVYDRPGEGAASVPDAQASAPAAAMPAQGPVAELARLLAAGEVSSIRLIGDSLTAGYGCDGYGATTDRIIYDGAYGSFAESAPEVACWANDLRSYAGERGVASFVNAGVSGAKMRWLAEDAQAWIQEGADVIFVMLGTNDAVYSSPEEFRAYAEQGLSAVAEACRLMVVLSPPQNERDDATNLYGPEVLDEQLRALCAERGYAHVSMLDALELHSGDFNDDQCHPTSQGSHKLWSCLRATLGL